MKMTKYKMFPKGDGKEWTWEPVSAESKPETDEIKADGDKDIQSGRPHGYMKEGYWFWCDRCRKVSHFRVSLPFHALVCDGCFPEVEV